MSEGANRDIKDSYLIIQIVGQVPEAWLFDIKENYSTLEFCRSLEWREGASAGSVQDIENITAQKLFSEGAQIRRLSPEAAAFCANPDNHATLARAIVGSVISAHSIRFDHGATPPLAAMGGRVIRRASHASAARPAP